MSKQVLSVGQCVPDDGTLSRFLSNHFDVQVIRAADKEEALSRIRTQHCDLILVNRKLDADYSDGLEVIKAIQADPDINTCPIMLVSNYPDAQEKAIEAGAVQGFGKQELNQPEVVQRLAKYLS